MGVYTIITPGPLVELEAETVEDVQAYVEDHVPMKRGWSAGWHTHGTSRWYYEVFNSNGRKVNSICVRRGPIHVSR